MVDIATLGVEVKSRGISEADSQLQKLTSTGKSAETQTNALSSSFAGVTKYITAAAAAMSAWKLSQYIQEATMLAARVETLGVVMKVVGNNAGYTGAQMDAFTSGLKKMGITTQESMGSLIKMAGAQMDLSKASQLARVAQDAAVIGGINSSEAFGRMIQGIRSGEVEILKTIGINVQFEQGYKKTAAALGVTSAELTNTQKTASRMSEVLAFGTNIAGAYEASMTTAGKAIQSLKRPAEEIKLAVGSMFTPALNDGVTDITRSLNKLADALTNNKQLLQDMGFWFKYAYFIGKTVVLEIASVFLIAENAANSFGSALASTLYLLQGGSLNGNNPFKGWVDWFNNNAKEIKSDLNGINKEISESYNKLGNFGVGGRTDSQEAAAIAASNAAREAQARIDAKAAAAGKEKKANEAHEKMMIDHSVSVIKDAWEKAETEISAEDFSKDAYKKMGMFSAKPAGFTSSPTLSLGVGLQIKSLEQVEQSEKDRLELLRLQSKELERQQAVIKYIADLNAANSATATSMVGMNSVGGFDSIEDQAASQMAILADAHKSRLDMIEIERTEKIASLKGINDAEKRAAEINTALNTKAELEKRKNTIATAAITDKSFKSQLSMTSQYVGMAGELFSALASTQDESSRSGFETAKAFNMAAAIMSTAAGIMAQFAAPDGALPSAWARAALVGVTGAIQVAKIASTSFGGGGGVVGAPAGSFAASGSASGTGTGISNLPQNISSIQDSRTNESIDRLTASTDNSALVIGKLSKSIDSLSALFDEDGGGFALANNAPNRFTQTAEIATMTGNVMNALGFGSSAVKFFKGDLLGSIKSLGSSLFGGGWQTTGAGIQLGINNGDVMARDYVTSAKSGGLFGKSKSSISYTENSDAAAYMDDLISPYISDLVNMARTLGTSVDTSKYSSAYTSIATAGRTPEAIAADMEKWFTATLQGMSLTVAGLESAIGSYDDAYEALKSMNDALVSTNEAFALVGKTALQGSFDNAKYALSLQNIFGGMDEFATAMDDYFSAMYTDSEQAAMKAAAATIDVNNAFAEMGLAIPSTNAAFNALRNSVTDPALFAALTLLGPTFAEMTKQSEELANVFADSLKTISQSASDAIRGILNSTLSTESPEVRYARAQREFAYATPEMAGELGKSLLDASRSMFASGDGYMSDYANVMNELTTLAGLDTTVDPNASTVAEIKTLKAAIVDLQKAIVDKLTVIEAPLVRVAANI